MGIGLPDTAAQEAIREVPHFRDSGYAGLDIAGTLRFYRDRYVRPFLSQVALNSTATVLDVGAGYGWLSIALTGEIGCRVIAVDFDGARLRAAQMIADILGVASRIDFATASVGALPLPDESVDVTFCIEVLEHVQRDPSAPRNLARVTKGHIVLTTPNRWFPVIAHDTRLPLCHWLPMPLRQGYARIFGRTDRENDNLFWSAPQLERGLRGFTRSSRWMHYPSLQDFLDTYPHYMPFQGGKWVDRLPALRKAYYRLASPLGSSSRYVLPTLAGLYSRAERAAR